MPRLQSISLAFSLFSLPLGVHFDGPSPAFGMTIRLCNGHHYFEMGLYNDFEIKQYGNDKKRAQIKISFSLNLKKKAQK
jgi:hypothetical protein